MSRSITVTTPSATYDALVGAGILDQLGPRLRTVSRARAVLLIHDQALPAPLLDAARASLSAAGLHTTAAPAHATEHDKSLPAAHTLLEAAAHARLERADAIVALGGGVVGDLAGFVASTYRRGLDLIHCPTTLLAMVDASIGGKTAVNLTTAGRLLKNMVGTFHQPRLVLADIHALRTLPIRHLRAGLAECIKHAMLRADVTTPDFPGDTPDADLRLAERFAEQFQASPPALDHDLCTHLIARNIAIKAAVVALDEREQAGMSARDPAAFPAREALNLGHTFGHALEAIPSLSPDNTPAHAPLHHGEAVALGLIAAAATAEALGQTAPGLADRLRATLERAGLPTRLRNLPSDDDLLAAMLDDKKVLGGRLRLILPHGPLGQVRICDNPPRAAVTAGLAAIRA